jgi:hypothetical protein
MFHTKATVLKPNWKTVGIYVVIIGGAVIGATILLGG